MPWKAPLVPSVTSRRSLSLPTQHITKSCPSAAALGVRALRPPCCETHFSALAAVRLKTVTSCPPLVFRCPAMGKPMTPRPRKATFAILPSVERTASPALHAYISSDALVLCRRQSLLHCLEVELIVLIRTRKWAALR